MERDALNRIHSRKELKFYIAADRMMNRGKFKWSWKDRLKHLVAPDYILLYLKHLRYMQYLTNSKSKSPIWACQYLYHFLRHRKLGYFLGFSIGYQSLGYGANIPHYGTIVVGGDSRIGNYSVVHSSTCVTGQGNVIGNAANIATGAKIISSIKVCDNVRFAANSVTNKDMPGDSIVAGVPSKVVKSAIPWYLRDGQQFTDRYNACEALRKEMIG